MDQAKKKKIARALIAMHEIGEFNLEADPMDEHKRRLGMEPSGIVYLRVALKTNRGDIIDMLADAEKFAKKEGEHA